MICLNDLSIALIIILLLSGCVGTENGDDNRKINTEIPTELSDNEKVKDYFETLEQVVNEYATLIEKLSDSSNKVESSEEPNVVDALNMFNDVSSSTLKMLPLLEKMKKLEQDGEILKAEMTNDEIEAFSKTYAKIMTRFYEVSKKSEKI